MAAQLWIVSGPSSVGKSHFLASRFASEVTGLSQDAPVLFPGDITPSVEIKTDSYLHYNLLRPARQSQAKGRGLASALEFNADPRWRRIVRLPVERYAVTLIADRETLLTRVRDRVVTEPGRARARTYASDLWANLYEQVELEELYAAWRAELVRHAIPCVEVRSEREGFAGVPG